jgi:hypothetical protein
MKKQKETDFEERRYFVPLPHNETISGIEFCRIVNGAGCEIALQSSKLSAHELLNLSAAFLQDEVGRKFFNGNGGGGKSPTYTT